MSQSEQPPPKKQDNGNGKDKKQQQFKPVKRYYKSVHGVGSGTLGMGKAWEKVGTVYDNPIALRREYLDRLRNYAEYCARRLNNNGGVIGQRTLDDVVDSLRGQPFWRFEFGEDYDRHHKYAAEHPGKCCAVHTIGIPENKEGLPRGIFPYEKQVFDALQLFDNIWVKKATGLGISEFFLYYFLWIACKDNKLSGKRICFITGPRVELTIMLMDRLKHLPIFHDVAMSFKKEVFEINQVRFEAFPSNDLDAARGLDRVAWWFLDEADFWEKSLQKEARTIAERYIAKSQARIVMVSTPNEPNGLFDEIEHEVDSQYYRIFLHYTLGVNYIYTPADIERAKKSPSFRREYGLEYLGTEGDVFIQEEIETAIKLGDSVNWQKPPLATLKSMGIDPGFSTSKYAICITNYNNQNKQIEIIYAREFPQASPAEMTKKAWDLAVRYNVTCVFVDASQNGPIRDLKYAYGERWRDYEEHVKEVRAEGRNLAERMRVVPVAFDQHTAGEMITKCQDLFGLGKISIPSVWSDLIVQLRSARLDATGKLDKKTYGTLDLLDAFRLSIFYYIPYPKTTPVYNRDPYRRPGGPGHNDIFK